MEEDGTTPAIEDSLKDVEEVSSLGSDQACRPRRNAVRKTNRGSCFGDFSVTCQYRITSGEQIQNLVSMSDFSIVGLWILIDGNP